MSSSSPPATAVEADSRTERFSLPTVGRISLFAIGLMVSVAESAIILLGAWLGQTMNAAGVGRSAADWHATIGVALFATSLFMIGGHFAGSYTLPSLLHPARMLRRSLLVCCFVAASLAGLFILPNIGEVAPPDLLIGTGTALLSICFLARFAVADAIEALIRRDAIAGRRVFLLGDAAEMDTLSAADLLSEFGLQDAGRLALRIGAEPQPGWTADEIGTAVAMARVRGVKEFVVALKWDCWALLAPIEAALRASPLPVRLLPHAAYRSMMGRSASSWGGSAYLAELQRAPLGPGDRAAKRVLDVAVASLALVALLPVMMLAAAAIKLDSPGPVIFRQRRNGFDQRQFTIFKFRTMHALDDGVDVPQARRGDARITRIGSLLRRTSIDELPQLLNVLRGDMSLVGPRPHAVAHDQAFTASIGNYRMRHRMKPGITGWAQISGCRGETARPGLMERRVECDLWYISHWSLSLDLRILIRTALDIAHHDAY